MKSTYDQQEEIDEMFSKCTGAQRFVMATAADASAAFPRPTKRQVLDLLRGGFTAEVAGGVLEALRSV